MLKSRGWDKAELHLGPGLLTQSLENPRSERKGGQRARVCTHTALKRNVGFCGLGFSPLSKHAASHASRGCASVCWGWEGRGCRAACHSSDISQRRPKHCLCEEAPSPVRSPAVSSEPSFCELLPWNEMRSGGGNRASVPGDMTHSVAYEDLYVCLKFLKHPFCANGDSLCSVGSKIKIEKIKSLHVCDTACLNVTCPLWGLKRIFWSNVLSKCYLLHTPVGDSQ